MAARRESIDRALAQLVLNCVQPREGFFGGKAVVSEQRERSLQDRQRLPTVGPLDENLSWDTAMTARVTPLNEDAITDELLEAALFDAEKTAHLVGG